MIVLFYILLYVAVHVFLQKVIVNSSKRFAVTLARDFGALSVVKFVGCIAGALEYQHHYS